jgi:hypothetical protein
MTKSNCYQAFGKGKAKRVSYPLSKGRYKLEELEGSFISLQRTLFMVRDYVSGESRSNYFGGCCASDKSTWLKRLPPLIAELLGYNLLPALLAHKNEGVLSVDRDYPDIDNDCLRLLDRLEQVRTAIKKDINIEYRQMKQGSSLLEPLIEEAIDLTRRALAVR